MAKKKNSKKQKQTKKERTKKDCKIFSPKEKILGFIELGRPIEWSKSLLNMFIAFLMVYYVYSLPMYYPENLITFIIGFLSVALLWSGLYALNDYTDWKIDALHETKKNRPIPSGKVKPLQGLIFSIILILIAFIIPFSMYNGLLFFCLFAMALNQILYTMKPFRLKSRKFFDIVSGSMINPFFRYLSGIVLFVPFFVLIKEPFPLLPVICVVGLQFSGYSLYRLFSKSHDKKVSMKSSVAILPEKLIQKIAYSVMVITVISYFLLFVNGAFLYNKFLGFLPPQYILAVLMVAIFVLATPVLRTAILKPKEADMKNSYRLLYLMNISFIVANLIVFVLIP